MFRRHGSVLAALFIGVALLAAPDRSRGVSSLDVPGRSSVRFQRLGVEAGLSQATARALAQDRNGFLWVGTQDGLNRYDGEEFRVFRHDPRDPRSLSDNHVTALLIDRHGVLWVGTQAGGLGRFDAATLSFHNFPVGAGRADAVANLQVQALAETDDGSIWVASGRNRLQRRAPGGSRFQSIAVPDDVQIRTLLAMPGGRLLAGSSGGLWQGRVADSHLAPWLRLSELADVDVQSLARAEDGRLWIGTVADGLFEFDEDGRLLRRLDRQQGLAGNDIRALLLDREQRLWVGTYTGLSRIDGHDEPPHRWRRDDQQRDGLASDRVHALFQGRDGVVWIGTWLSGLNVHLPGSEAFQEFRHVPGEPRSLPGNAVRSVVADGEGGVWLGVQEGGGLVRLDPDRGVIRRFVHDDDDPASIASNKVQDVVRTPEGDLWIGFVDAGLDRLAAGSTHFEHFPPVPGDPTRPGGKEVQSMSLDRSGTLWVGYREDGMDALCRGCSEWRRYRFDPAAAHGLPGRGIGVVFESTRGSLWVGGFPGSLARLDRASGQFTALEDLLDSPLEATLGAVSTMTETRSGDLWIGTQGNGLLRLQALADGRFHASSYTHREGLAAQAIGSILEDDRGRIWFSTTQGVSRLDPTTGRVVNFGDRAGVQSGGYFIEAGTRLADGRMVLGGLSGVTVFLPGRVTERAPLKPPVITDIRVFQSSPGSPGSGWRLQPAGDGGRDQLWLKAGAGGLGFSFSALAFAAPDLVEYSYRLDPLDHTWIDATPRQRNAGYPHLSPGSYELHLRARYPGQDYGPERVLDVHLAPLWWQSNWARTAFVLAVLLPFAWVGWNRRQRSAERARAQADLAESEERLKLALWGTGDEFWDADLRVRRLVRVNPLRHPGTRRERESLPFNEFRARIHPEDRATFVDRLRRHLRGNSEEFDCSYRLAIDVGPDWCWVRTRGRSVQHDSAGRPQRMAGITEDITELRAYEQTLQRINQELERRVEQRTADLQSVNKELVSTIEQLKLTQHQLFESEKLAALGSLVAGVAHEVNTPLGVGVTAASHLEQQAREFAHKLESGEVAAADFAAFRATLVDGSGIVLRNLQRADRMIRSFKQVAVDQASEAPRRIDVSAYLDEVLLSLQPTLKRHPQRVEKDVESGLVVLTHPGAIYQIIVNLVMNSLIHGFARRNDGRIRIVVRRVDDHWWLEYSDDGCGMTEEVRRHIFEPFFTTRRGQGGSGLGLHIVYNLVVQGMGGSIECETAPDRGTRFSIRIPMLVEASAGESAPAPRTATE